MGERNIETHEIDRKPVAVLGGRGMLGTDLVALLRAHGMAAIPYDLPELDLTRPDHVDAVVAKASAIVNCAAYTNVDGAESEPDLAEAVNARAVGELGCAARRHGCHVLHIGTDFVFDGALERPYGEEDTPNPVSVYGRTKLAGERALQASGCSCAVVRVQWTYGQAGRNFVSKVLERAAHSTELRMVADQVGSPTWTRDVSAALVELLRGRQTGVFHYAADGYATRLEVAEFILRACGLDTPVVPCRTSDFPSAAQRPLNSRFDCRKIDRILPFRRPDWQNSMREFLRIYGL